MRLWFENCYSWLYEEENVYFAVTYAKPHPNHPWKGFTLSMHLYKWILLFNYVDNYEAYDCVINQRKRYKKEL